MSTTAVKITPGEAELGALEAADSFARDPRTIWTEPVSDSSRTSLRYFNVYRLIVAVFLGAVGSVNPTALGVGEVAPALFVTASIGYVSAAVLLHAILLRVQRWFVPQLFLHFITDVVAITTLIHASGGFRGGLGVMLLISLAGAALLANRRLTLLFASIATIAILGEQALFSERNAASSASLFHAAILGVAYFITALITNWLAQLALVHEGVSRERAIDLANQERINALVIQDVHDGIVVVNDAGIVRQLNRKAQTLLGHRFWEGRRVHEYSPELAQALDAWWRAPSTDAAPIEMRESAVRARVRFQSVGVHGRQFVLALLEDLSRLEAEAQSMKLVALGRLTANIAHEIRNPLSAITHAADLMMEEKRAESRERLARIIRDNALRLDRMVKDVLELNRRDRVQVETIVLAAFLVTFVEDFLRDEKLPADAVALEVESAVSVQFDRVHLHQILWNLVRNAWRYSSKGPRSVQIRLERAGSRVELQILDDGPGVPPECRAQLFEPFFTTDSTGTGLGLYISRELAGANGAQLDYQPRPNGSAFKLHWQGVKS